MTRRLWFVGMALILLVSACSELDEVAIEEEMAEFEDTAEEAPDDFTGEPAEAAASAAPCPFAQPDDVDIDCGFLTVPENRRRAGSPTIELAYAIVYAAEDEGLPPLVYLAGGPGSSAIDEYLSDPEGWDFPFTRTRDLVLIDQRGTGYSYPTLDCPEMAEEYEFEDENPERVCRERLVAEGIDLAAYHTTENAADVEALRQALGIPAWDLLAISYGTRLALNIMRDYPGGVRSAVLDSVFPPNADTPNGEALAPLRSLELLFADCAADDYCAGTYPDLEQAFLETVAALNDTPENDLYGDDFVFAVTAALNDTLLIPLVPYVIDAVANGDLDALDEIDTLSEGYRRPYQEEVDRSDSEGMYNSVICHEEYVFSDYETVEAAVVAAAPEALEAALLQGVANQFESCSFWGAGTAGAVENQAVQSEIPTLILAGLYDHATPPEWGWLAAETLSRVFVYEFPGAGHSLLSGEACAISITAEFLDVPEQEPDSRCLAEIEWPYFE